MVELAQSRCLHIENSEIIFFAAIQTCANPEPHPNGLDLHYYSKMGHVEIVDMTCVQCVVGRIQDPDTTNGWVLMDRSGNQARAVFNDE